MMCCSCKSTVLFLQATTLLPHPALPPSSSRRRGSQEGEGLGKREERREGAATLQGSLCYLETDGLLPPANRWLGKTDPCALIGQLLPGTHCAINGRVIVSSGRVEANYTAPVLCADLFSAADTSQAQHTHTHTHTRTNLLLDSPRMSQETEGVWESEDLTLIAMRRH